VSTENTDSSPSTLKNKLAELDAIWRDTGDPTEDQQSMIEAFRSGQIDEEEFQLHLSKDPVLANCVLELCRASNETPRE